jgi:hypothetical protein
MFERISAGTLEQIPLWLPLHSANNYDEVSRSVNCWHTRTHFSHVFHTAYATEWVGVRSETRHDTDLYPWTISTAL